MIFGGTATVEHYKGNPRVQAHGPGFSKILLGDDVVDQWEKYLDLMADSIYLNSGRGCINCSGVWASRHTREIAEALAERLGPIEALPPDDPKAGLAAFTVPGRARPSGNRSKQDLQGAGVTHMTAKYGPRLVEKERASYLRPTIMHCAVAGSADRQEGIHVPVRDGGRVPAGQDAQANRPDAGLHGHHATTNHFATAATNATHIDRLNIGPIPTTKLNWLQPHEGNIVDFLFRGRALASFRSLPLTGRDSF